MNADYIATVITDGRPAVLRGKTREELEAQVDADAVIYRRLNGVVKEER